MTTQADGVFPAVEVAEWRRTVEAALGERGLDALRSRGVGGPPFEPLYTRADWSGDGDPGGWPGVAPYRRGGRAVAPEPGLPWVLAVRAEDVDLDRLARDVEADLVGGASGIWVRFDGAARRGADPADAPAAVGDGGAPLYAPDDLERAFGPVEPALVTWLFDAGGQAAEALDVFLAWLERRGVPAAEVAVVVGADPLGALARDGALPCSLEALRRRHAALVGHCDEALPRARALRASSAPWLEAGALATTALGLALAAAADHLRALGALGVEPARVARQTTFEVSLDRDVLESVAVLRGLRVAWSKLQRAFGVEAPTPAWTHAYAADRLLAARDPWVNLLRATTGTFAAIVGGADAITTPCFDAPLGAPDALGRRVARNTQLVLGLESHLGRVVDPAGGAHAFEALTDAVAREAWETLRWVEREGGLEAALRSGAVGARVAAERGARAAALASGEATLLGVTRYPPPEGTAPSRAPRRTEAAVEAARQRALGGDGPRLAPRRGAPDPGAPRVAALAPVSDEALQASEGGAR